MLPQSEATTLDCTRAPGTTGRHSSLFSIRHVQKPGICQSKQTASRRASFWVGFGLLRACGFRGLAGSRFWVRLLVTIARDDTFVLKQHDGLLCMHSCAARNTSLLKLFRVAFCACPMRVPRVACGCSQSYAHYGNRAEGTSMNPFIQDPPHTKGSKTPPDPGLQP